LVKNNVTTLQHPQYSSDLAEDEFLLVSSIEISTEGRRFCYATDIIKNATKELKRL